MTTYIILERAVEEGYTEGRWVQAGEVTARGARSAIRAYLDNGNSAGPSGQYVAVPSRSFVPVTVNLETKKTLKFS